MDELEALNTVVVGLSQEDKDLASAGKMAKGWPDPLPFELVFDFDRAVTKAYDRTSAYLIDEQGVVRQVFPMLIHHRPSWEALLGEVRGLANEKRQR